MAQASRSTSLTASGALLAIPEGEYVGYVVTTVTATGSIRVFDNASAASGTIIDLIPAATAAGASRNLAVPIRVKNGIYVEFNGGATGTVTFFFN